MSILVGGFPRGKLIFRSFFARRLDFTEADILEFNTCSGIVDLQADPSLLEILHRRLVTECGGEFSVDKKFELVATGNDSHSIPVTRANGRKRQGRLDGFTTQGAVGADGESRSSQAGRFIALGEVKVPRAKDMRADADMPQISVVAHKRSFA